MALNVGSGFKQRWCATPEAVRQLYLAEFERVCDLLGPETDLQAWQQQDQQAAKEAETCTAEAYAQLKTELIEAEKLRKQAALEQALSEKRADEQARLAQLQSEEQIRKQLEKQHLQGIQQQLQDDLNLHLAQYQPNPAPQAVNLPAQALKAHLQAQAEQLVEQAVTVFRAKLLREAQQQIAQIMSTPLNTEQD